MSGSKRAFKPRSHSSVRDRKAPKNVKTLVEQFMIVELTPDLRGIQDELVSKIESSLSGSGPELRRVRFNRCEVELDRSNGMATIEDDLDTSEEGRQRVPLPELLEMLRKWNP